MKIRTAVIILILLALDWVALHDIFADEPDVYREYGMLLFSAIVLIGMIVYWFKKRNSNESSNKKSTNSTE